MKIPQRKPPAAMAPDLTPMIDVTFMLLIFFLVATTFRQVERRLAAELPTDEGPFRGSGPPPHEIKVRMDWCDPWMQIQVLAGAGAGISPIGEPVHAGTLQMLMQDRASSGNPHTRRVASDVIDKLRRAQSPRDECRKVTVELNGNEMPSGKFTPDSSAPWGFIALVVSACAEVNAERKSEGKHAYGVAYKTGYSDWPWKRD